MTKLGVGVVGVGLMGKRHAENVRRAIPEARLVAVADADAARARSVAEELEIEHSYDTCEELVSRKDIQAVVIVNPAKFHAEAIRVAASAGKHILCEKPLALTMEDATAARNAVNHAGVLFQIGFMRRYDPPYADAKRRIEAGEIGEPIIFKSIGRDQEPPPPSYLESGLGGMLFLDSTIHDFDLALWMMNDEVAEVQAFATRKACPELAKYDDIDAGVVNLRFAHGSIGNIESFRAARYGYDIRTEVVGTKGTLMVGYLRQTAEVVLTAGGGRHNVVDHWLVRFAEAYLLELRDFVRQVLAGRPPRVTFEDGTRSLAVALAARRSLDEARPVMVDRQDIQAQSEAS